MAFRDRIKELRRVKAGTLRANAKNWREHPEGQRSALTGMLEEVGFVGALIARETPDGLVLLDGHLRADLAAEEEVPVLVVDVDDKEANKVLATFDPISALAVSNEDALQQLLAEVDVSLGDHAELRRLLTDLHADLEREEKEADEQDDRREVPGMALQPHEHYDYLVVLATTTQDWNVLCEMLGLQPKQRRGKMGTARAIRAKQLIDLLHRQERPKSKAAKPQQVLAQ